MAQAFVVETGAGLSTATTYISLADCKQYWDNQGYVYTATYTDPQLQAYLNRATKAIDGQYYNAFPGERKERTQALEWPRYNALYLDGWEILSSEVPAEIKNATAEMAYACASGTDIQPTTDGDLKSKSVSVGPVSESKTYASQASGRSKISAVTDAMKRILGTGAGLRIMRV